MKLIVDAQLPRRLAYVLRDRGHDVMHTLDLPDANRTTDKEINRLSIAQNRIVITKDEDFVDSFLLKNEPYKLCLFATGNISNNELLELLALSIDLLEESFEHASFIEINREGIIIHL